MKRFLPLTLLFLVACESSGTLQWVSPTAHSTVGGSVILQVQTVGTPPENVVFSANGQLIAKSYDLKAVWDTSELPSGDYILEAKPFGAPPSYAAVRVRNVGAAEPAPTETDPLELGPLLDLDVSPFREFISRVPPGSDFDDVFAAERGVGVQQVLTPDLLPRGVYAYDEALEDWVMTPGGEDFLLTFAYVEGGEIHEVEARVSYGATRLLSDQEVPEALALRVTDNAQLLLYLDTSATYRELPGCRVVLEPESIDLSGGYNPVSFPPDTGGAGASPPNTTPIQDVGFSLHYLAADDVGNSVLNTRVDAHAGSVGMFAQLDVSGFLDFVRRDCALQDINPQTLLGTLDVGYLQFLNTKGLRLTLDLSSIQRSPFAALMTGVLSLYDGPKDEQTRFSGELSDPNRDGVPGENAHATLPNGIRRPLDVYLKNLWETYLNQGQ